MLNVFEFSVCYSILRLGAFIFSGMQHIEMGNLRSSSDPLFFSDSGIFCICCVREGSTCRRVLIQSALCSPNLGECFEYLEYMCSFIISFSGWH